MFSLIIKKSFFGAWDNLGLVIVLNLVIAIMSGVGLWILQTAIFNSSFTVLFIFFIMIILLSVIYGLSTTLISRTTDYKAIDFSDIIPAFKCCWKVSFIWGSTVLFFLFTFSIAMLYYLSLGSFIGLVAVAILFWIMVIAYLGSLWFFPLRNRLSGNFLKSLKKSYILLFDNVLLTFYLGCIVVPLNVILWPLSSFIAFGPAGISIFSESALRILMFKYDWLEAHPDLRSKDIPWDEILTKEHEMIGHRTFRDMIFPWKY